MSRFPQLIKSYRIRVGETQTEFGQRFGVSHAAVSEWESGKSEAPYKVLGAVLLCDEHGNFQPSVSNTATSEDWEREFNAAWQRTFGRILKRKPMLEVRDEWRKAIKQEISSAREQAIKETVEKATALVNKEATTLAPDESAADILWRIWQNLAQLLQPLKGGK